MITYFTGSTYNQVMQSSITEIDELVYEPQIEEDQDFNKFIKQNLINLSGVDCLILDISVCLNTDEELLSALEMIRTMYDNIRLIIFAPYRVTGDKFLTSCLAMGITNIINTDDFNEIRDELKYCIQKGMTYRDAVKYKERHPEKVVVKHVRRTVNKRMIGIAGAESNIGVTHSAIVMANYFRKKGFMVALAEVNDSGAFKEICEDFEESMFEEGYFTMNGVDFYPDMICQETERVLPDKTKLEGLRENEAAYTMTKMNEEKMQNLQTRSYNIIILDFGMYSGQNREAFERCEDKIIIAGSKSWELEAVNKIFANASKDVLLKYVFCFNFTMKKEYEAIRKGMGELQSVHFLKYLEDPFMESDFPDGDEIFADILPEESEEEGKQGIVSKIFHFKGKSKEEDQGK